MYSHESWFKMIVLTCWRRMVGNLPRLLCGVSFFSNSNPTDLQIWSSVMGAHPSARTSTTIFLVSNSQYIMNRAITYKILSMRGCRSCYELMIITSRQMLLIIHIGREVSLIILTWLHLHGYLCHINCMLSDTSTTHIDNAQPQFQGIGAKAAAAQTDWQAE